MSFMSKVIALSKQIESNQPINPDVNTNIYTSNFKAYDSMTNKTGWDMTTAATATSLDLANKTVSITNNTGKFTSSRTYIVSGFTAGGKYKFSVKKSKTAGTFIRVICRNSGDSSLYDSVEQDNDITFTVPANTFKIQLCLVTNSSMVGTVIFSDIQVCPV